jgi:peroxin-2
MSMRYATGTHGRRRLWLYYTLTVLIPYLAERWCTILSYIAPRQMNEARVRRLQRATDNLQTMCALFELLHFVVFLQYGGRRSLAERVCALRAVHDEQPELGLCTYCSKSVNACECSEQVDFTTMNRELMWHAFADVLMLVGPLINVRRLKNTVTRWFMRKPEQASSVTNATTSSIITDSTAVPNCYICSQFAIVPKRAPCTHTFCYSCLHSQSTDPFTCPQCFTPISLADTQFCYPPSIRCTAAG